MEKENKTMKKHLKETLAWVAALAAAGMIGVVLNDGLFTTAHGQAIGGGILGPARIVDSNGVAKTWTNSLAGTLAQTNVVRIDTGGFKNCAIEWRFQCATTNAAGSATLFLGRSSDGDGNYTNIERFASVAATLNGLSTVVVNTNFSDANNQLGGIRYMYIMDITNGGLAGALLTNYTVTYNLK